MRRLTADELNRATLARQLLLQREPLPVVDAVRRVVALQAQEPASPYVSLWNRVADFDPAALDHAFSSRAVIKATLMRITMHAVEAADYPAFHAAMQPTLRAARLNDGRFRRTGLSPADADVLIPDVLAFADRPRTNAQMEAWFDERIGEHQKPSVWWALRHYGPFVHATTGGPWSFGPRPSYTAAPDGARERGGDPETALRILVRRYLEGFGPASIPDVAQFALVHRARVRAAIEAMADTLERVEGPGGTIYDVPGAPLPHGDTPAPPRLLAMWDSGLLAYADRSRVLPPEYRRLVTRTNGDVLPTLLVDGYVAGVWRPLDDGIEATAFRPLDEAAWAGLDEEARGLRAFLAQRERDIYRRYARWWAALPAAEVRVLGG